MASQSAGLAKAVSAPAQTDTEASRPPAWQLARNVLSWAGVVVASGRTSNSTRRTPASPAASEAARLAGIWLPRGILRAGIGLPVPESQAVTEASEAGTSPRSVPREHAGAATRTARAD